MTTTTAVARANAIHAAVSAGQTVFTRTPKGTWMVVGPVADITVGAVVSATKKDGTTKKIRITVLGVRGEKQGLEYQVAHFEDYRPAPAVAVAAKPARSTTRPARAPRCTDHETDNNGQCYSCGAYVRSADVGRFF